MNLYPNRLVVKVGTSTLTNDLGNMDLLAIERLVRVLSDIQNRGYEIILVSSGAIAVGKNKLKISPSETGIRMKQASAAVGQCSMMFVYDKLFADYDKTIAQILLSAEDIRDPSRKQNLMNTFESLLELGVIPIVNENDSVTLTEIESEARTFGDNDMLSAIVSVLCSAEKLVILSDLEGFYSEDPQKDPSAPLIPVVPSDCPDQALFSSSVTRRGRTGALSKIRAARYSSQAGVDTVISDRKHPEFLYDLIEGIPHGTLFPGNR